MYGNILLSTDGSDVARKGVKHGIALAKALNAKVTVITVTEPLPIDYGSGHASGWIPSQEEVDRFDAACKERAGKALDEARAMAEQSGVSSELLHIPNATRPLRLSKRQSPEAAT
jgi:nucleotide-binding universal stress UspA family protein